MADQEIQQNIKSPETNLRDVLNIIKKEVKLEMYCHAIGTIQSFDPVKQTAVVTINYLRTYYEKIDKSENYAKRTENYPILLDCPVIVLCGGLAGITFPISQGDECILLFNDRSIDNWFHSGQILPVNSPRLHSISDAIALVGVRNQKRVLSNYDTERAVLFNDKAKIAVGSEKIEISNDTKNLNTLLQQLITILVGLQTTPTVPANPAFLSPATILQLNQLALDIGGLLE
jgi:hypothetical protein